MGREEARGGDSEGVRREKKQSERSVCLAGKPSVKIVFHIFQCLIAPNKKNLVNGKLSLVNGKL